MAQERIATLRRELAQMGMEVDLSALVKDEEDSHSDSTATGTKHPTERLPFEMCQ